MLAFSTLLKDVGIDPADVVAFRHRPPQLSLRQLLPSFVVEHPDLFAAYQAIQGKHAASVLKSGKVLASFIGEDPGQATFAGLWRVGATRYVTAAEAAALPGMTKLMALGMEPAPEGGAPDTLFELEAMADYAAWIGKLVVAWPAPGINWKLRVDRHVFSVHAIHEESRFARPRPTWTDISVRWSDLPLLPHSWRGALQEWRGVYYIFDEARRLGYVGSASGGENLFGRWRDYAATGHGGDVRLRASRPEDLTFSILELTSPACEAGAVLALEESWKARLMTRKHGLNAN